MLRAGKITVEEAEQLLDALGPSPQGAEASGEPSGGIRGRRRLCIRITALRSGKVKTDVRLPSGAWGLLARITRTRLGRRMGGLTLHDIQRAAREGATGHVVDLTNEERGERVEIFFE